MGPSSTWIADWAIDEAPAREEAVARELLQIFTSFWTECGIAAKAKSTQRRYAGGLHALGGYVVEKLVLEVEDEPPPVRAFLVRLVDAGEGPLIYIDNEAWQNELDRVCRKLHAYLASR